MILASCVIGMIYQISSQFDEHLKVQLKEKNIPISGKHANLFMILHSHDNMEFKDIASTWKKSKSTLCDIISRYVDLGLIDKINCCQDKRHVYVKLSIEGKKYATMLEDMAHGFLDKATEGLTEEEKDELKGALKLMRGNL